MAAWQIKANVPGPLNFVPAEEASLCWALTLCSFFLFFPPWKGTIMEQPMLITAKEFEACANSPSPIRSPPSPAIIPSFPSLALHHWLFFFFFLNLYTRIRCSDYFQLEYKDARNLLETVFSTKEKAIYLHICHLTNLEELNHRNKRKEMIIFLGNDLINSDLSFGGHL